MTTLQVTIPDDVRDKAEKVARKEHMSLDEFTTLALIERLTTSIPDPYLEERAKRGNPQRLREILAQVPDVPPDAEDKLE
mgnify:CR=1 FL=1